MVLPFQKTGMAWILARRGAAWRLDCGGFWAGYLASAARCCWQKMRFFLILTCAARRVIVWFNHTDYGAVGRRGMAARYSGRRGGFIGDKAG
jgi:hypothetical protein